MKDYLLPLVLSIVVASCGSQKSDKHLFILSGQSNMARLNPALTFTPTLEKEFGSENIVVVHDAKGTSEIGLWYQEDNVSKPRPELYARLMTKVDSVISNQQFETATFVWMQGERDARLEKGDLYVQNLMGLYNQLSSDIGFPNLNFVIGRLSDFDMNNSTYPHWTKVREAQMLVADTNPQFAWINTDDLNDGLDRKGKEIHNDLHMSAEGYEIMGKRFANQAITLIHERQRLTIEAR